MEAVYSTVHHPTRARPDANTTDTVSDSDGRIRTSSASVISASRRRTACRSACRFCCAVIWSDQRGSLTHLFSPLSACASLALQMQREGGPDGSGDVSASWQSETSFCPSPRPCTRAVCHDHEHQGTPCFIAPTHSTRLLPDTASRGHTTPPGGRHAADWSHPYGVPQQQAD